MKLKNILKIVTISAIILTSFTACGDDASFKDSEELIPINIACVTSPDSNNIDSYITLNSGDTIVKDNDGAEISIYHDVNGVKKVCLVTPSAHIIRK